MNRSRSLILALAVVLAALCLPATSALAAEPTVSVTITAPANNAFSAATPSLVFSTTGTGLLKTCSVTGPGVEVVEESCSSSWNPGTLPDGTYTYTVSVEKVGDGGMASASRNFKIDKTAPVVTIGGTPAAGTSNTASIALTATVADANPAFLNCRVDNDLWGDCGGTITNGTFNLADALVGGHSYQFAATDKAGNMSVASRSITIDRTAPVLSITSTGWGTETKDNTPAFLLNVTDATAITKTCSVDGAVDPQNCPGSTFLVADPIADGVHVARLMATDAAGNSATATFQFTLDATMPMITHSGFENDRTTNRLPEMEFWASDEHAVITRCGYDAAAWDELIECGQGPGHLPMGELSLGTHQYWISATDSFGNIASTVYTFEVVEPTQQAPGGEKPGGVGADSGAGKTVPRLAVAAKASKVKRAKFTLTAVITLTPASGPTTCEGSAVVTIAPKVKKAKAIKAAVKLTAKAGTCVGTAKFKLASKLKKKKAGITVSFGGNAAMAQFTSSPVNLKL